ncbi:FMN-binding protein [Roseburia intestinalis]|nr:FMN-binding protein [Roseburia intestinalis]
MITVLVTVENGTISEIEITSADGEDKAYLSMAEDIIPKIIEAQSADVDTVSGATFSSTGIRDTVSEALKQAEQ